jgi:hypothetical protein
MGFSWALHWTQEGHRNLLSRAGLGGLEREWVDRAPAPALGKDECGRIVYVDNEVFIGRSRQAVDRDLGVAARALGGIGLPIHEVEASTQTMVALGLELDGVRMTASLSSLEVA